MPILNQRLGILVPCHLAVAAPRRANSRLRALEQCLTSVLASIAAARETAGPQWSAVELVVIDDHSSPALVSLLSPALAMHVRLLTNDAGAGQGAALNFALEQTDFDVYGFTDSDCIVAQDWIAVLGERFFEHPEAPGFVGPNWLFLKPANRWSRWLTEQESGLMRYSFMRYVDATTRCARRIDCRNLALSRRFLSRFRELQVQPFVATAGPSVSNHSSYLWRVLLPALDQRIVYCDSLITAHRAVTSVRSQISIYFARGRNGDFDLLYASSNITLWRALRTIFLRSHFYHPCLAGVSFTYTALTNGAYWLGILLRHRERRGKLH